MWSLFSASYVNVRRTVNIVCNQYIGQVLNFSKYISKSRAKRLPLTTKRAGKGYYKGNRCRKEGKLNSKGRFRMIKELCTELVVPDLSNFKLKPYIAPGAKRNMKEIEVQL